MTAPSMTNTYSCYGKLSSCGKTHQTAADARRCCNYRAMHCRLKGGYSDIQTIVRLKRDADGMLQTCMEVHNDDLAQPDYYHTDGDAFRWFS